MVVKGGDGINHRRLPNLIHNLLNMSFLSSIFRKKSKAPEPFELLNTADYKKAVINKDVQLVDVRTPGEYRKGHLAKAKNINFYAKTQFVNAFEKLDKSKPLYIYCRSGHRSRKAAMKLIDMGFIKIYDLKGGINNWQ